MPSGLGKRQRKLVQTLLDFERSGPAKDAGLSTAQLAAKVFGKRYSLADRTQTSRALNALAVVGMVYKVKRPSMLWNVAYWRIHPRIAGR